MTHIDVRNMTVANLTAAHSLIELRAMLANATHASLHNMAYPYSRSVLLEAIHKHSQLHAQAIRTYEENM